MVTIGLLWHSISSDNLGVGALTVSQIAICQSAAQRAGFEVEYIVFGSEGSRSYAPKGLKLTSGGRISIKQMITGRSEYLRDLERCDIVFDIGEGDSFTDIYGLKRFLFLIASKIAVLVKGKQLVLGPQTIGPFNHWYTRVISAIVMRRCQCIFTRDDLSVDCLHRMGITDNVQAVTDIAFRLPFIKPVSKINESIRIGINVSGLLFSGGYNGDNQFGIMLDYPELIRRLLANWTASSENEVWLIPHVMPNDILNDDDRIPIDYFLEKFPSVHLAPEFNNPSEAKSFIATMDFVTGARMHVCIAAFSSGIPVVPLSYSRKFNGLFSALGYSLIADAKVMTTDLAYETIVEGFRERAELARHVALGNRIAQEKLECYEGFIVQSLNVYGSFIKETDFDKVQST
jgi:colanic acid/amylovoran biosynthesis protein